MGSPPNDLARRARALLDRGAASEALALLQRGGAATSRSGDVAHAYVDALHQSGATTKAMDVVEAASAAFGDPSLLIHGAGIAAGVGDRTRRDAFLATALARFPDDSSVHAALGDAAGDDADPDRAVRAYRRAIELHDPSAGLPPDAVLSMHIALMQLGDPAASMPLLQQVDRRAATLPRVHSARLLTAHYLVPRMHDGDAERRCTLDALAAEHRRFGERYGVPFAVAPRPRSLGGRKLRIAYLSGDFRDHSVARFFVPMLRAHDRERFEIVCYATSTSEPDATTREIASLSTAFVDLRWLHPREAAARIAADAPDVLVELGGHTAPDQMEIVARRVAPVQLTFLGYPDVSGLPEMDGFVTDEVASPPAADAWTVEPLVRLPHVAWTFEPPAAELEHTRAPGEELVFGAFHNLSKVTDDMLALWGGILARVPGARLATSFRAKTDEGRARLERRLEAAGVPLARVTILGPVPERTAHLARLREVDVMLDTFPYAGTTTTCDALWMGVPVVTLAGESHASRVGASLLHAVHADELVASTPAAYVDIAVALAEDAPRRAALRASLRDRMRASPLGDAPAFTRSMEALYTRLHAERKARPEFPLVATGEGRIARVGEARVVLPGTLGDPPSFLAVERGRVDDGELALAIRSLPPGSRSADVLPGTGASSLALAAACGVPGGVHVVDPVCAPTLQATLAAAPKRVVRLSRLVPWRARAAAGAMQAVEHGTLDEVVKDDVALVRIGAPGVEVDVLGGAARIVMRGAVVVLDRVGQPLGPAAKPLEGMGLVAYGLVPMLGALAKVASTEARGALVLVSRETRARFGAALPVLDAEPVVRDAYAPAQPPAFLRAPRGGAALPAGVDAFVRAAREDLPLAERLAWLLAAIDGCAAAVRERPNHVGRRLSLCRALLSFGSTGAVGPVLAPLLGNLGRLTLDDEPFLPALPRYDAFDTTAAWLDAQVLEAALKHGAPSSFFHGPDVLPLFARFDALGFPDAEMDRRESLLRSRFGA